MSSTSGVRSDESSDDVSDFSDVSFYILDDSPKPASPLPMSDDESFDLLDDVLLFPEPSRMELESSTSSLFIDDADVFRAFEPLEWLFYDSPKEPVFDDLAARRRFERWAERCMPRGETYAVVSAVERLLNPPRTAPEIPSLFKKRDVGCGYCRSVGYRGADTHTRQTCRQLRQLAPCKICGASGAMNHTETYCPEKPSMALSLAPEYLESSEKNRPTREFCFYSRYASFIDVIFCDSDDEEDDFFFF